MINNNSITVDSIIKLSNSFVTSILNFFTFVHITIVRLTMVIIIAKKVIFITYILILMSLK